jgi:hypothetical protein
MSLHTMKIIICISKLSPGEVSKVLVLGMLRHPELGEAIGGVSPILCQLSSLAVLHVLV